jgi:hypothetical protein
LLQPFAGNAIHKRELVARLSSGLGKFRSPLVRANDPVISCVASVATPITVSELETLSDYGRELLIGTADPTMTAESVSSLMAPYVEGCHATALAELLNSTTELVFGRCFDDADTHAAFQWYGLEEDLQMLEELLLNLSVNRLGSRTELANLLRE